MKINKVLTGILSVAILSLGTATAFAAGGENLNSNNEAIKIKNITSINSELNDLAKAYFGSFTGKITEINAFGNIENSKILSVKSAGGMPANFLISEETYVLNQEKLAVGAVITGYYKANAPMVMIYPPRYDAKVIIPESEEQNVKVDVFNEDLVSSDNFLKLNLSEKTEVISQDGIAFDGELANRKLVVLYTITTKSIPAQTSPSKIVVLNEEIIPPVVNVPEEKETKSPGDVSTKSIMVNGKKIASGSAYLNEQGVVMVPLRSIAAALDFEITWDKKSESIRVGKGISLKIGEDNYLYMKTSPLKLGTAPAMLKGTTFVPLSFFEEVMRINNVSISESQIIINDLLK